MGFLDRKYSAVTEAAARAVVTLFMVLYRETLDMLKLSS